MTGHDCEHGLLQRALTEDRLVMDMIEVIRCPGCYVTFTPERDSYKGDVYLKRVRYSEGRAQW